MYRLLSALLVLTFTTASAYTLTEERVLEKELTKILQDLLLDYDPYYLDQIYNLNMTTDLTRVLVNATTMGVGGQSQLEVTKFQPPVAPSKAAELVFWFQSFIQVSNNCTLNGTYDGHKVLTSGVGVFLERNLTVSMYLDVESTSLDPPKICFTDGALNTTSIAQIVEVDLEGQADIAKDLSKHGESVTNALDQWFTNNAHFILGLLNQAFCQS